MDTTNNNIFKNLRCYLRMKGYSNEEMFNLFKLGGIENLSKNTAGAFACGEQHKNFRVMRSHEILAFLEGLVIYEKQKLKKDEIDENKA